MKSILIALLYLCVSIPGKAQMESFKDTLILGVKYDILDFYKNGLIKEVGNYGKFCNGKEGARIGNFYTFNRKGKITKSRYYHNGYREDKRLLFLKHGWWECNKYFLGFSVLTGVIRSPCF